MARLIVTADDFGYSARRDAGILTCFRRGGVSRASLLVNGVSAAAAAALARQEGLPLGLHLNLTEGLPVHRPAAEVASLLSAAAVLRGKHGFRAALRAGQINMDQVRLEAAAQLSRFCGLTGRPPLYVDGHQHVHVLPGVCETLAAVMASHDVRETRLPRETALAGCGWVLPPERLEFYQEVARQAEQSVRAWREHGIRFTDGFVGMVVMGADMTIERLQDRMHMTVMHVHTKRGDDACRSVHNAPLGAGDHNVPVVDHNVPVVEWMVHPGRCGGDEEGGCGDGVDEFALSADREHEMEIICSEEMQAFYRKQNIQLVAQV